MEQYPVISIVIPTLNRSTVLREAVISLKNQTEQRYEIIVIDNGPSVDDTERVMLQLASNDSRIIYHKTTKKGDSIARNIGCRIARAPIIMSMDDDWEMTDPDSLRYIVDVFEKNKQVGVLSLGNRDLDLERGLNGLRSLWYPVARRIHRSGKISRWGRVSTRMYYLPYGGEYYVDHVKGACLSFVAELSSSCGFFPTLYMQDGIGYRSETELCRRIADKGYLIMYSTLITGLHKATPRPKETQSRARTSKAVWQWSKNNMLFTCRNYWSRNTAILFLLYDIVVGNFNQPGAIRVLGNKYFMRFELIASSIRGKWDGYKAYKDRYFDLSITE